MLVMIGVLLVIGIIVISLKLANGFGQGNPQRWISVSKSSRLGGAYFGQVVNIRQRARRGTKAYVRWSTGSVVAVWVPHPYAIRRNDHVVLVGETGAGTHHNENVFYVRNVLASCTPRDRRCYEESINGQ